MSQDDTGLVRALATELARFQARGPLHRRHLGFGWISLCGAYPSPGRACSARCAAVTRLLTEAALYLHCDPRTFYLGGRPRARRER